MPATNRRDQTKQLQTIVLTFKSQELEKIKRLKSRARNSQLRTILALVDAPIEWPIIALNL